jgi:hypothetical protein
MKAVYRVATGEILSTQEGGSPDEVLLKNVVDNHKGVRAEYAVFSGPDALHDEMVVALSKRMVDGQLVLDKAPDHEQRVKAFRQDKQRLIELAASLLGARTDPSTTSMEQRLRAITDAWYRALADPRAFDDSELADFQHRLGPVQEKLRALAYHRGHLERYRLEAQEALTRLVQGSSGGAGIDSSACLFEFPAFLFQARAVLEVFFRSFHPLTRQIAIKRRPAVKVLQAAAARRPACGDAAKLLLAAEWVDEWEDDTKKPGSLRRAIVHYGGLQISPLQAGRSDTRLIAVGGLMQDGVDLLRFVDNEIARILDLVISVSVVLFAPATSRG